MDDPSTLASAPPPPAEGWRIRIRTRASDVGAVLAAAALVALVLAPLAVGRSTIQGLFSILTMLTLAQSWNFLAGTGGLVSVGQQAFVGLGGYALFAAVAVLGLGPLAGILVAGAASILLAVATAAFVFRLEGAYFAIGTWVVSEVVRLLVAQWKGLGGGTGTSLPRAALRDLPGTAWIGATLGVREAAALDILCYLAALALAVATIGAIYALSRSRYGLGIAALRDNRQAAEVLGVDALRLRAAIFLFSSLVTGLCGGLIYLQKGRISPDAAFSVADWTAYVIFVVVIGGIGTVEGPIVGVLCFYGLRAALADYGSWYLLTLGCVSIAVMIAAPRGIWGLIRDRTAVELFPVRRRAESTRSTHETREAHNA